MVKIEIVHDLKKKMRDDNEYVENVLKGKVKPRRTERTIIMTPETFAKIFSPQRIKLLLEISENKHFNIYQITKVLGRKYEAVYRDIKLLEGFGIIRVRSEDNKKYPFLEPIQKPDFSKA